MDAGEPHARRRGMFVHVDPPEPDASESESAEGVPVRAARRKATQTTRPYRTASPPMEPPTSPDSHEPGMRRPFRFESGTDSRRPSHMSR